jgi:hypothetical protein
VGSLGVAFLGGAFPLISGSSGFHAIAEIISVVLLKHDHSSSLGTVATSHERFTVAF